MVILDKIVNYFISSETSMTEEEFQKRKFLLYTVLTTFFLSIVYYVFLSYIDFDKGAQTMVFFIVMHIIFLILNKLNTSAWVIGNLFAFMSFSGFVIIGGFSSGISSAVIAWYISTIVSAYWYAGKSSGIFWSTLSICTVAGFFIAEIAGYEFQNEIPIQHRYLFSGIAFVGVMAYYLIVITTYEKWQNKAKNALEQKNDEILAFNEELMQQAEEIHAQKEQLYDYNKQLNASNQFITSSINSASRIQEAMLGEKESIINEFKSGFIFYLPKDIVSGDFYWFSCKGDCDIFVVGDCTGHGVPGAFMTIMAHNLLDKIINNWGIKEPKKILEELDKGVLNNFKNRESEKISEGMDLAVVCINYKMKKILFSGAKSPLFYYTPEGEFNIIQGSRYPIGSFHYQAKFFVEHEIDLVKGTKFYLFSDGYQDQFGGDKNSKYMKKRFRNFIKSISEYDLTKQHEMVVDEFYKWKRNYPQTDDIIISGFEIDTEKKILPKKDTQIPYATI
ncbi:SpoIIE family protein phosphatase [Aureibacter tunicatorum]|uniref:Serine phosphatase RsbU (Regulator of sigma subunit) n=1 Tax=Aureibacter tunicatorum TaxID=866807 RepID=A0AAE3XLK1_9BACT|nr:SpoIIE family protein phosphatase [Aureibacter tunicatorum]MDR6238170.1 serine phosphatase RsbU (regulator of sigma subunit) [Aureibacter tunicatorum]BDD03203.1 hypothetical protein AUTU_06860 [Aureibacter tunicatorum]